MKNALRADGLTIQQFNEPAGGQVVLGTTNPDRVAESAAGAGVRLTREEWYRLFRAAGHKGT